MYSTIIDGIETQVVNRPWTMEGTYSDEMNLQTAAVRLAKNDRPSSQKFYNDLLERKLKYMNEIDDIRARRAQAKGRPGAEVEMVEFKGTGGKSRRARRKSRHARRKSRHTRRKSRHARK